jgi:succinoglycan biosynthesis protein ExoO
VARGKWLAFIDADDAWLPNRLEKMIAAAGSRNDVIVFDDIIDCHDSPEGLVQWRRMRGRRAFGADGKGSVKVAFQDYIRQRRLLIKPLFPARIVSDAGLRHSACRFGEDTEYFLRLIEQGLQLVYVPEAMYLYRITQGSLSANPRHNELMLKVLTQARERMALSPAEIRALEDKIAGVQRDMRYAPFLQALKGQKWLVVFEMLRKHPGLLLEFIARLPKNVPYRLHRWLHQAEGR